MGFFRKKLKPPLLRKSMEISKEIDILQHIMYNFFLEKPNLYLVFFSCFCTHCSKSARACFG